MPSVFVSFGEHHECCINASMINVAFLAFSAQKMGFFSM